MSEVGARAIREGQCTVAALTEGHESLGQANEKLKCRTVMGIKDGFRMLDHTAAYVTRHGVMLTIEFVGILGVHAAKVINGGDMLQRIHDLGRGYRVSGREICEYVALR